MNEIPRDPRRPAESSKRRFRQGIVAKNEIGTDPRRDGQGTYRTGRIEFPVERDAELKLTVAGMACKSLKKIADCGPAAIEELALRMVRHSKEMDLERVFPNL